MPSRKMHQTTVRFGSDLWEALAEECDRLGVSVAQYVREAAMARLAYAAAKRGDPSFEAAMERATGRGDSAEALADGQGAVRTSEASEGVERARVEVSDSSALWAERRQSRQVRDESSRRTG